MNVFAPIAVCTAVFSLLLQVAQADNSKQKLQMPASHWIGPYVSPDEYLTGNQGLYDLDAKGILVTLYKDRPGQQSPRIEYNPGFIANYAITACRHYITTKNVRSRSILVSQLEWLRANARSARVGKRKAILFPYSFEWVKFGLKAPWVSAFSQALVGNAFACGADATGILDYEKLAAASFAALLMPTSDGGVTTFGDGTAWFEEAAAPAFPSIKILNGNLTAMEGLKRYLEWRSDPELKMLWQSAIAGVRTRLSEFDGGYMSFYAQFPPSIPDEWEPSGRVGYNIIHMIQLMGLYEETGETDFLLYALRFAQYESPSLVVSSSGATAPETNGPDRINMVMGNDYWSHSVFPATVTVDMGRVFTSTGLHLISHTLPSAPRDYVIEASKDGKRYSPVANTKSNTSVRMKHTWPAVRARYLRVIIANDNGNKNVTLKGVYPLRGESPGAIVSGPGAMSVSNLPALSLELDRPGWRAPKRGYVILHTSALPGGVLEMVGASEVEFHVTYAKQLSDLAGAPSSVSTCDSGRACLIRIPSPTPGYVRVSWAVHKADETVRLVAR